MLKFTCYVKDSICTLLLYCDLVESLPNKRNDARHCKYIHKKPRPDTNISIHLNIPPRARSNLNLRCIGTIAHYTIIVYTNMNVINKQDGKNI